jgi:hypothetical protein
MRRMVTCWPAKGRVSPRGSFNVLAGTFGRLSDRIERGKRPRPLPLDLATLASTEARTQLPEMLIAATAKFINGLSV